MENHEKSEWEGWLVYLNLGVKTAPTYNAEITDNRPLTLTPDLQAEILFAVFKWLQTDCTPGFIILSNGVYLNTQDIILTLDQHYQKTTENRNLYRILCASDDPRMVANLEIQGL